MLRTLLSHARVLVTDPLHQSALPVDAGSFCTPSCSGKCASAADDSAGCGWCAGATGGAGSSTSTTGPRGATGGGFGTLGSAAGSCYCACKSWHWQGAGCPAEPKKKKPAVSCAAERTCSSCLGEPSCAWCGSSEQCFSRQAQSNQTCDAWHELTCSTAPVERAFAPSNSNRPGCSPGGSSTGSWDLSLLQLPGAKDDC